MTVDRRRDRFAAREIAIEHIHLRIAGARIKFVDRAIGAALGAERARDHAALMLALAGSANGEGLLVERGPARSMRREAYETNGAWSCSDYSSSPPPPEKKRRDLNVAIAPFAIVNFDEAHALAGTPWSLK